ncbi:MvdC/MvdD family ATP grasp protein [Pseudophaeobacter flagellatus]|uniref:MvdC/MvdD family ATP grasp protein n=1 Tax=Pseudophaeobacter flagellatus TaxID=2899119 RepID=UPI001E460E4A|nr:hypothetical protein [Pseudophaeobacter flagellatus]MCD9148485.1 hypothetical protein [Pseudophaeobacter flagellatus]
MILLVTNKRDITTDFIVLELKRREIPFFRLNSEDLPRAIVRFEPKSGWVLRFGDTVLKLCEVKAGYYRRPGAPEVPEAAGDAATRDYIANEWSAVLRSLWNALEGRWLNSPFAILRAEDKPRQLSEAYALGFSVPETMIGNDFNAAATFIAEGPAVGKPLRHALIETEPNGEVLFTQRLGTLDADDRAAVALAPVIYQREIAKAHDLRVTVIGSKIFAVAIHSQQEAETQVDWRRGSRLDLPHELVSLPDELAHRCLSLTKTLGLRYGAIDLIRDTADRYWFLEINPNGQWAWIERRTGAMLSSAIIDEIMSIAA